MLDIPTWEMTGQHFSVAQRFLCPLGHFCDPSRILRCKWSPTALKTGGSCTHVKPQRNQQQICHVCLNLNTWWVQSWKAKGFVVLWLMQHLQNTWNDFSWQVVRILRVSCAPDSESSTLRRFFHQPKIQVGSYVGFKPYNKPWNVMGQNIGEKKMD